MLLEIDRLQLATPSVNVAAARWSNLLGAVPKGHGRIKCLNATYQTLQVGRSEVEILEPDGAGIVSDAVAARGAHMFSAGASCHDVPAVQHQLNKFTTAPVLEDGRLYVEGTSVDIPGLRLVVSPHEDRSQVGYIDYLYEATVLAGDANRLTARFAEVFALDAQEFVEIDSPRFGYNGKLTLFKSNELHRFEVITPLDADKTMGRFFSKVGPCLYMSFAETSHINTISDLVAEHGLGQTIDRPETRSDALPADQIWLHPGTLGGVMLGLSRPTMAWSWSGSPERVKPI